MKPEKQIERYVIGSSDLSIVYQNRDDEWRPVRITDIKLDELQVCHFSTCINVLNSIVSRREYSGPDLFVYTFEEIEEHVSFVSAIRSLA